MSLTPLTIIITSDETRIVTNGSVELYPLPYIKIQVIPDETYKNIKKIKITYQDIYDEITNPYVFDGVLSSMCGNGTTMVEKITHYSKDISDEEKEIIMKEYNLYIDDGTVLDGFIAGIAVYLSLLYLIENNSFSIPFEFTTPFSIDSGNMVNRNMFRLMSLPFIALSKTHDAILSQAVKFIQSFINIWEPAFTDGPIINTFNESKLCIEIVTGYSQYTIDQNKQIQEELKIAKQDFISYIEQLRREIKDMVPNPPKQIHFLPPVPIVPKEIAPVKQIPNDQPTSKNTRRISFKDWIRK
jgi:hypothetical protein